MKHADRLMRLCGGAVLLAVALHLQAQPAASAPDAATQRIIDALLPKSPKPARPPAEEEPRTRSARNLIVREAVPEEPPAAPSLSMQIQFDFDSARLRPEGEADLLKLAAALRSSELAVSRFLVEGHTDAQGSAAYNLRLSQSRADEVRRFLRSQGVSPDRLSSVGRGAQQPANAIDPLAAENRRVRIVNLGAAASP